MRGFELGFSGFHIKYPNAGGDRSCQGKLLTHLQNPPRRAPPHARPFAPTPSRSSLPTGRPGGPRRACVSYARQQQHRIVPDPDSVPPGCVRSGFPRQPRSVSAFRCPGRGTQPGLVGNQVRIVLIRTGSRRAGRRFPEACPAGAGRPRPGGGRAGAAGSGWRRRRKAGARPRPRRDHPQPKVGADGFQAPPGPWWGLPDRFQDACCAPWR